MNNENKFDTLLEKIVRLISMLNYGCDEIYHFEDIEARDKKISKLRTLITDLTQRTTDTLKELFDSLR